jgi:hypothetical protein
MKEAQNGYGRRSFRGLVKTLFTCSNSCWQLGMFSILYQVREDEQVQLISCLVPILKQRRAYLFILIPHSHTQSLSADLVSQTSAKRA